MIKGKCWVLTWVNDDCEYGILRVYDTKTRAGEDKSLLQKLDETEGGRRKYFVTEVPLYVDQTKLEE